MAENPVILKDMAAGNQMHRLKVRQEIHGSLQGGEVNGMEKLRRFFNEEEGVTLIEYGLIAALVAVALVTALTALSGKLQSTFNYVASQLK
jgi:pilus assembly protein Flp/PilA